MAPSRSVRLHAVAPYLVFAAAFLAFLPVLGNGFVDWDDPLYLVNNPHFRGLGWENVRWMFTNTLQSVYQPLAWLTLAFDFRLWGMEPGGYHLQSLLWHAVNSVVVYHLALRLLSLARGGDEEKNGHGALIASLLFAVHPLRTEALAWASERREVVGDFFWILGAVFYLRAARTKTPPSAATTFCLLLALLAKGTMLSLPLVLLALDYYPLKRLSSRRDLKARVLEKWPLFALSAAFGVLGIWAASSQGEDALSFALWSPAQRLAQLAFGLAFYARKTAWPFGLSYLYYMPTDLDPSSARFVLSGAVVAFAGVVLWRYRRRFPAGAAAAAAYAAALFPVLGVMKYGPHLAADRYSNLSCLPVAVLAGAGFARLLERARGTARAAAWASAALFAAALGILSARQAATWRDSMSMWTNALAADPDNPLARANAGIAASEQGDFPRALVELTRAYSLAPGAGRTEDDLGALLARQDRWEAAAKIFAREAGRAPSSASARAHLAKALGRAGRRAGADAAFRAALALDPRRAETHYDYGVFLLDGGRGDEALERFEAARALDPSRADAAVNAGLLLARSGRRDEAVDRYRAALSSPDRAVVALAQFDWGNAMSDSGRLDEAASRYREAARLDPGLLAARFNLGNMLARRGKYGEAAAQYRALLARSPSYPNARRSLAAVEVLSRRAP